jgi:tetratricopeptide (TPR) repeat protein/predicted Ser/Thr protein kinase
MTQSPPLPELLRIDQRARWRGGDPVRVESYLEQHPSLQDDPDGVLDLIYNEIVLREEVGERPVLEEYRRRFPQFDVPVRLLFEVHQAVEEGPAPTRSAPDGPPAPAAERTPVGPPGGAPDVPGYEVLSELGHGGMGVVYKARQVSLNRSVALKVLLAGPRAGARGLSRFQSEAEVLARLQHPNIVQVYEVGEHEGRAFFAMEYVAGASLSAHIAGTPRPAREAARLVADLARAMHFAHERGVVHRDLKPQNVLLTPDGTPKIGDFGLAKQLDSDGGQTRTGDVMGTPSYMAPEQAAGKGKLVGPATDVYALGAILYEMLTGRPPFRAGTDWETVLQVLHDDPAAPRVLNRTVPRDLETVCLKCLRKAPAERYASALALADDLRRFLDGKPVIARRVTPWERALKWAKRRPTAAALLALAAMTAVGLTVGLWQRAAAERRRQGEARAEARAGLERARAAFAGGDWQAAQSHLESVLARAAAERSLDDLRPAAEGLLAEARGRQYEAETYREFVRHSDEALFHGLSSLSQEALLTGMDAAAHRRAAEGTAREALALAGLAADGDGDWAPDPRFRDPARRAEMTARCCALLLVLADAAARRPATEAERPAAYREALRLVGRAARVSPPTRALPLRRAHYLGRLGDTEGARRAEAEARATPPAGALDYFLTGDALYRGGDLKGALASFRAAVGLDPGHFWAQCCLAACHLRLREWGQAASALTVCLVQRPDFVWARLLRGFAHRELGAFPAAEADFERARCALEDTPNDTSLYVLLVNRGVLRLRQGHLTGAEDDLRQAAGLQPDNFVPPLNLARVYQRQGRAAEAARQLERARGLRPPPLVLADYHAERARDLFRAERFEAAEAECREALRQQADHTFAHRQLGHALLRQGRHAEAARAFDRYVAAGGPPDTDVYRGRGLARMRQGDYLGARDDYTRALELRPDASIYLHRGWAYFFLDAWRPALADFEEALRRSGGAAQAPGVALLLGPAGMTALRLEGIAGEAYTGRGLARVLLGQYREAVADAGEALRRGPKGPEMMHNVACVFALAVGKVEADPAARDRGVLAAGYRAEAVQAIRRELALVPAARRRAFWRDKINPDSALDAIRQSPEYQQLLREYGAARPSR